MAISERTRKRDGVKTYYIDFRDQRGRRVRELAGTTRTQAKNLLKKRLGEVQEGSYVNPNDKAEPEDRGPTFKEFSVRFMRDYGKLRRSHYYTQQLKVLTKFFGDKYLREITRADIDLFAADRARQPVGKRNARTVGPSTVRKDLVLVATVLKVAVRWGVLDASPAVDLPKPAEPHHKTRYLTQDEWKKLLENSPKWLRSILTVALSTGMRLKEILGLRWEDVDRSMDLIYISEDNKTGRPRVIPLGDAVRKVLDGQVRHLKSTFVFTDTNGTPYTKGWGRNYVGNATKAAMKAAGIQNASFHTIRHTAGSWLAQQGESEVKIARLLGHASTRTTARYMHLRPDDLRKAVQTLDAAISDLDTQLDTRQNDAAVAHKPHVR